MTDARATSDPGSGPGPVDRTDVELDVPPDAEVYACERCGERFPRERQRDLHLGLVHDGDLTDAEREAYAVAASEEGSDLRRFRLVSLGLLVVIYFGFLFLYAVAGTAAGASAVAPVAVVPAVPVGRHHPGDERRAIRTG